ncbi:kinase-like protein [Periconia macrospinosa]|uniref:Autophagy-related protein 1 n=1 Tax=Periconia macrospinosa TaxID=97972 RepID=A0A2V1DIS6_9PLEO|nr:kinase-like protein [Periconia macrospinosa]
MSELPAFVFPRGLQDSAESTPLPPPSATAEEKNTPTEEPNVERPRLAVRTRSKEGQRGPGYRSSVPEASWTQRPHPRGISTPPESPIRSRAYTMGADHRVERGPFEDSPMSPPLTPITAKHASSNSDVSLKALNKGPPEKPKNNGIISFPFWDTDYEILTEGPKAIKKVLGSGVWSDVYHAIPTLQRPSTTQYTHSNTSRPLTPRSRSSSNSLAPSIPCAYAIKTPSSAAAQTVLTQEAHILSHLTRLPKASDFLVAFYGQDPRTGALVLKLMDQTLDSYITNTLNTLPEPSRAAKLAASFPHITRQLLTGLDWLHSQHCIHADIKPGNILISTTSTTAPQALFTDFSSAILSLPSTHPTTSSSPQAPPPIGGGTWDFLAPCYLSSATANANANALPTPSTDLWATAVTLLILVTGVSPFAFLGANVFQRREVIKKGDPVGFVGYGDFGERSVARLRGLGESLGTRTGMGMGMGKKVEMVKWFRKVLVRDEEKRVEGAGVWLGELQDGLGETMMMMGSVEKGVL